MTDEELVRGLYPFVTLEEEEDFTVWAWDVDCILRIPLGTGATEAEAWSNAVVAIIEGV